MTAPRIYTRFKNSKGTESAAAPVVLTNMCARFGSVVIGRPNSAIAYDAKDMIGIADAVTPANPGSAIIEFPEMASAGGVLEIRGTTFMINVAAVAGGMGTFTLHLFNAAPAARLDNDPFDIATDADRAKYLGAVGLGAPLDMGSTLFVERNDHGKRIALAANSTSLFGILTTDAGYIPTAGAKYTITLHGTQVN